MKDIRIHFDTNSLIKLGVLIGVALLLVEIRGLLVILLTSVVVATFAEGFINFGKRVHLPRVISVILFYLLILAAFGGVLYFMIPILIQELGSLQSLYPEIGTFIDNAELLRGVTEQGSLRELLKSSGGIISQSLFKNIASLVGGLANAIILLVVSFYLSVQERGIERFIQIITPRKYEGYAVNLWMRTKRKISSWFNGQLLLALILVVLTYVGLTILGAPYALVLALLAGVFGIIPYGIILALIPAVGIAFINGGWQLGVMVLIMYILIQQITDYILQPLIIKKLVGLPTLVVILSIIVAANIAGFLGVVIAVPVAVFLLEVVHDIEHNKERSLRELEMAEEE